MPDDPNGPANFFVARVMKAGAGLAQELPGAVYGGLPVLWGNDLDRISIMAAMKRRQVADIDAGTYDLVNRIRRNVAAFTAYKRMGCDHCEAVPIG